MRYLALAILLAGCSAPVHQVGVVDGTQFWIVRDRELLGGPSIAALVWRDGAGKLMVQPFAGPGQLDGLIQGGAYVAGTVWAADVLADADWGTQISQDATATAEAKAFQFQSIQGKQP